MPLALTGAVALAGIGEEGPAAPTGVAGKGEETAAANKGKGVFRIPSVVAATAAAACDVCCCSGSEASDSSTSSENSDSPEPPSDPSSGCNHIQGSAIEAKSNSMQVATYNPMNAGPGFG